jgi:hypothetical protein
VLPKLGRSPAQVGLCRTPMALETMRSPRRRTDEWVVHQTRLAILADSASPRFLSEPAPTATAPLQGWLSDLAPSLLTSSPLEGV